MDADTSAADRELELWRYDQLVHAGYPPLAASALAVRFKVDLHEATALLAAGCTVPVALRILADE